METQAIFPGRIDALRVTYRVLILAITLSLFSVFPFLRFCALSSPAFAQSPPDDILPRLNDRSYEVREQALGELLADDSIDEEAIAALLRQSQTAEQRHRLIAAAKHHVLRAAREADFGKGEHASLGISHDAVNLVDPDGNKAGAVYVILTLPGFSGHAVLRSGDLITAIDGKPFPPDLSRDRFAAIIRSHEAGTRITMTVRRGEAEVAVTATLASGKALEAMYDGATVEPTFRYAELWRAARARLEADLPPVPVLGAAQP